MNKKQVDFIGELNDAQKAPVVHKEGPLIVIAGAGSGKTRVLTYRIAYLIQNGVDPFEILSLTFTNKAAREMKERISTLIDSSEAKNLWMGTFHSVFARLLRAEADKLGFPSNFTIYDTQDSERLIASIIKEMKLEKDIYKTKQIRNRISAFKNSLITVKAYHNDADLIEADKMARRPKMGEVYNEYVERCFKSGAMDFDDLLLRTNELLNRFPRVLSKYQNRFKYILVDEYQDTNHSQYLIVKALSDKFHNICVVGDDAQSIYAFRGANINNILNFQNDYEDVKLYRLEQNYRSTKNIVNAANSIINHNQSKIDKVVWTSNQEGSKIKIKCLASDADEGRAVASIIFENKMNNQKNNKDFAVLYRTNAQSRAIEDSLRKRNIQYRVYGGLSFYQRKEIKDIIAYLRIIINPNDEESLKRIINYPARGIGSTTIDKLIIASKEFNLTLFEVIKNLSKINIRINNGTREKLNDFLNLIKLFQIENRKLNAYQISDLVIKKSGIINILKSEGTPENISKIDNIEELLNGIRDFTDGQLEIVNATGNISEFLEDIALATDFDNDNEPDADKVSLMTIHLAKGLEFPTVFIVGLEEDLFPSAMSLNTRSELEEERRLFYVAVTRAKEQAYITYTQSRYRWGKLIDAEPSRFIEEIDDKYVEKENVYRYKSKPLVDASIFESFKQKKEFNSISKPNQSQLSKLKRLYNIQNPNIISNKTSIKLVIGMEVSHGRFGKGKVLSVEGSGNDKKAAINFQGFGVKNLLIRFAKLTILNSKEDI
tara:strand:+ start:23791 stop:26112 length:2322 start_codon:yes stop_codon:yes gene_type:complete